MGKTVLARALATSLGAELSRVQGHPDLLPSDITGVSVFMPDTGSWDFRPGPVFAHIVLVDELNRTPPRTQSALLETMEERQVSVDGQSWPLPQPHLVIATQNPQSQRGTFPLVESQLDRFAMATPHRIPRRGARGAAGPPRWGHLRPGRSPPGLHAAGMGARPAGDRGRRRARGGRDLRRGVLPGHPHGAGRASRRQPPGRHLAHPCRPGARRAPRPALRGARRRQGRRRGLPVPSHPHRRGRRRRRRVGRGDRDAFSKPSPRPGREPLGATRPTPGRRSRSRCAHHRSVVAGRPQRAAPAGSRCWAIWSSAPS